MFGLGGLIVIRALPLKFNCLAPVLPLEAKVALNLIVGSGLFLISIALLAGSLEFFSPALSFTIIFFPSEPTRVKPYIFKVSLRSTASKSESTIIP